MQSKRQPLASYFLRFWAFVLLFVLAGEMALAAVSPRTGNGSADIQSSYYQANFNEAFLSQYEFHGGLNPFAAPMEVASDNSEVNERSETENSGSAEYVLTIADGAGLHFTQSISICENSVRLRQHQIKPVSRVILLHCWKFAFC